MDLEHRVKALEQEVKLLKGQIQRTLLDIQEQILIQSHPSLRGETTDSEEESGPLPRLASARTSTETSGEARLDRPGVPKVKKVSLQEVKTTGAKGNAAPDKSAPLSPRPSTSKPPVPSSPAQDSDWDSFAGLVNWAGESVAEIGKERTIQVLNMPSGQGTVNPEIKESLLQLISLSDDENPPEKVTMKDILKMHRQLQDLLGRSSGHEESLAEEDDLG